MIRTSARPVEQEKKPRSIDDMDRIEADDEFVELDADVLSVD